MSFLQFDATAVAPQQPIEAVPAGTYLAAISESEVAATKSGTGQMLRLTWDVIDGPMKGRKVFDRLNIANQNPKAEEIGQRQLSTLCHAVGVLQLKDTTQLHGRPCQIRVTIRKDESGQYADQNEVKDYRAINGQALAAAPTPAAATPAAKKFAPPWAGNKAA
jgi:hypothetical protein